MKVEPLNTPESLTRETDLPFNYFFIQAEFANKWAEVANTPLHQSLFARTTFLYHVFSQLPKEGQNNQRWIKALKLADKKEDPYQIASLFYNLYLSKRQQPIKLSEGFNQNNDFGFFDFSYFPKTKAVTIHFSNRGHHRDISSGLLDYLSVHGARDYFIEMIKCIKTHFPEAKDVYSKSWILNYMRIAAAIFPPTFVKSLQKCSLDETFFPFDTLWGQFLDWQGKFQTTDGNSFLSKIDHASTTRQLAEAFPYWMVAGRDDLVNVYSFYGL